MKRIFTLFFFLMVLVRPLSATDFSKLETFTDDENLWKMTSDNCLGGDNNLYFRWLSDKKAGLRYPGYSNSPGMTFLGKKCYETIIRFDASGKVSQVDISIYNRGDAGEINDEKAFQALLDGTLKKVEEWSQDKGVPCQKERLTAGMFMEKRVWVKNSSVAVEMRWSASEKIKVQDVEDPAMNEKKVKFRAEYIKLTLTKFDPKNDPRKMTSSPKKSDTASALDIKQNVKKDDKGFFFIDNIPMVDQGEKGYCAVATAERILRYYGTDVDQNVVAQLANSSATGGTSPDEMVGVLKKVQTKFGVFVKTHNEFKMLEFMKMVTEYNKLAKKARKKEIVCGNVIDIGEIYHAMDPALLKEIKCEKDKNGYKAFCSDVVKHVDMGIPLIWGVELGIVPEEGLPQTNGGHMRIIFGYNKDKNEILYTDSWGQGHERSSMSMDNAWTITSGLYSFDPRKK